MEKQSPQDYSINICDYGVGNVTSVVNMFKHFGFDANVTSDIKRLESSDLLVLPGQGAFASAMSSLKESGLDTFVSTYIKDNRPFLGICVGFQLLFEGSDEFGFTKGLGLLPGIFKKFSSSQLKVPHMGWNRLLVSPNHQALFPDHVSPYVYFVHSYFIENTNHDFVSSKTEYGSTFISSVHKNNLFCDSVSS